MSAAIAALVLLAPGGAQGMTEIGAVEEPVPVRVFPIAGPQDLGRYAGGEPFDPLPRLRLWDARSQGSSCTGPPQRKDRTGHEGRS